MAKSRRAASKMITWETYKDELKKAHEEIYNAFANAFAENSPNPLDKEKQLQQVFNELWRIVNSESSLNEECAYPRDSLEKIDRYFTEILDKKNLDKKIRHFCNENSIFQGMISKNKFEVLTGSIYLCYYIERRFFLANQLSKVSLADFKRFVNEFDKELNDILNKQIILKEHTISSKADKINHLKIAIDNELISRAYIKNKSVKSPSLVLYDNEYVLLTEAFFELPSHDDVMKACNQYSLKSGREKSGLVSILNDFKQSLILTRTKSALVISNIINAYLMIVGNVGELAEVIRNIALAKRNKDAYFKHSKFLMLCFENNNQHDASIKNLIEKCKDISPAEKIGVDNGWSSASDVVDHWVLQVIKVQDALKAQYMALLGRSSQFELRLDDLSGEQDTLNSQANILDEKCKDFRSYYEDRKKGIANNIYNLECNIDDSLAKHQNWFASHWWKMLLTGIIVSALTTVSLFMFMTGLALPVIAAVGALALIGGAALGLGIGIALPKSYSDTPSLDDAAKRAEVAAESQLNFDADLIESSDDEELDNILSISSDEDVTEDISTITTDAQDITEEPATEDKAVPAGSWFSWFGFFRGAAPVEQVLEEKPENQLGK